jgi:hypothetical protein
VVKASGDPHCWAENGSKFDPVLNLKIAQAFALAVLAKFLARTDELIEWGMQLLHSMSLLVARNGYAEVPWRCPLLGEQRKTSTRGEYFRF